MNQITIRKPDDFHLHLRQGEMLHRMARHSAPSFARGLLMPNTDPPLLSGADALAYKAMVQSEVTSFEPLMVIKITPRTTAETVREAGDIGVVAGKLYPEGVTTNSADGFRDFRALWPILAAMQQANLVLSVHGEMPGEFCLDREKVFIERVLEEIAVSFPDLRIVLEHVSTAAGVDWVESHHGNNIAATITVHHLLLTLDHIVGGVLEPHHFCKPIPKRPDDRERLVQVATSGNARFFLGTDSAPHLRHRKECTHGCAGVFTAPVALPLLAEIFEAHQALEHLETFTSCNGAKFYGMDLNSDTISLIKESWMVPGEYSGVVPLRAGEAVSWKVKALNQPE